ncbi:MAG TPA: four helix bundle protein [Candidatus Saccharimonadales bacterium]|nr:four helix bundle protein [Candidatus Saccharimonadales bacterium]
MPGKFDSNALYERLYSFSLRCQKLTAKLPKTAYNLVYTSQLLRSSGSVGANYIEALEGLSKKDFVHRLKISRKETRESVHWLRLIKDTNPNLSEIIEEAVELISEGQEIKKIFTSSIITSEQGARIN